VPAKDPEPDAVPFAALTVVFDCAPLWAFDEGFTVATVSRADTVILRAEAGVGAADSREGFVKVKDTGTPLGSIFWVSAVVSLEDGFGDGFDVPANGVVLTAVDSRVNEVCALSADAAGIPTSVNVKAIKTDAPLRTPAHAQNRVLILSPFQTV
jgi:hypothetical protein